MDITAPDLIAGFQQQIATLSRMHAEQFALVQALERENISIKQQLAAPKPPKPPKVKPE